MPLWDPTHSVLRSQSQNTLVKIDEPKSTNLVIFSTPTRTCAEVPHTGRVRGTGHDGGGQLGDQDRFPTQ